MLGDALDYDVDFLFELGILNHPKEGNNFLFDVHLYLFGDFGDAL